MEASRVVVSDSRAACCCCVECSDPHAEGGAVAEVGSTVAETRPLLSVQRRRVDTADGHVHRARSLARLCLVLHRTTRS